MALLGSIAGHASSLDRSQPGITLVGVHTHVDFVTVVIDASHMQGRCNAVLGHVTIYSNTNPSLVGRD
jgi:hypothetical protein